MPLSKDFGTRGREYADPEFYRCGGAVKGFVRSTFGDPDLRSPSGFDSGLRPPLRMTRRAEIGTQSLNLRRICWIFGVTLKLEFTPDYRRYFFSFKLIKKPSPVGEGGPREWWKRSPRDRLTYIRHLIRQPSAATFSHWRRLSFVSALYVNKQCRGQPLHNGCPRIEIA